MLETLFGKKNIVFSILGIGVLCYGGYLVFKQIITPTEAIPFLGGLYGLVMKNQKAEIKKLNDEVKEKDDFLRDANNGELINELENWRAKRKESGK